MQQDLFGEPVNDLVTVKSLKQYSKEQKDFQKLCEKIDKEKVTLAELKIALDNALSDYNAKIAPVEKKRNQALFKVLQAIDATYQKFKYTVKTKDMIVDLMEELLLDIAFDFSGDSEFDELYNKYYPNSEEDDDVEEFDEEDIDAEDAESIDEIFRLMKQNIEDMAYHNLGVKIDLSDVENVPDFERIVEAKIDEAMGNNGFKNKYEKSAKPRKKTKKQLEKEAAEKILNDSKDKSLKSIYVSLAKALHPDLEQDEDQKLVKQELMKLVTIAYRNNDLQELLNLQLKWVHNESAHLETLSTNQLKVYIQLLKEKLAMCIDEKRNLAFDPRYYKVRSYAVNGKSENHNSMEKECSDIKAEIEKLDAIESKMMQAKTGKLIKEFVEDQLEIYNSQMFASPFGW